MIDLAEIRIRDRDTYANITDENSSFLRTGQVDRHDLLQYVDELREAAGKIRCASCKSFDGRVLKSINTAPGYYYEPCPDCADLRKLL